MTSTPANSYLLIGLLGMLGAAGAAVLGRRPMVPASRKPRC